MSTTGWLPRLMVKDHTLLAELLKRSLLLATAVALLLIALSIPIQSLMAYLSNANEGFRTRNSYFSFRIFITAALCNWFYLLDASVRLWPRAILYYLSQYNQYCA